VIGQREAEIVAAADIRISMTCVIGSACFNSFQPQYVIIDEANQLVDPELLSVLGFSPDQQTLYGHHTQIGPFSHSRKVRQCGYALSLIEHIWKICADRV
jgi:hypothetical protein